MKKLFIAVSAALCLASCSNDQIVNDSTNRTIRFSTVMGNHTRATTGVIDLAALKASTDGFAVCTNGLGYEMSNVAVKYSAGAWNYTGDYFWPADINKNVSFTSYAPAGTTGVTLSSTGITVSGFTPVSTPASQVDLIYASPANFNRATSGASGVTFAFNHLLTQVVFSVTTDIPSADLPKIVSIALTVPKSTGAYDGTTWTASSNPQTYTVFSSNSLSSTAVTSTPLLMVPQTLPVGTNAVVTFSVEGASSSNTVDLSTLATVKSWNPGTKVTYNITFTNADLRIKFSDPTISSWTNASDAINY